MEYLWSWFQNKNVDRGLFIKLQTIKLKEILSLSLFI